MKVKNRVFSDKISRKNLFEAFFTVGGRLVSIFLVIVSTKFLTNFLSAADYGRLSLYNVTATLPSTFFFGPLGQGILRYYPIANEKKEFYLFNSQINWLSRVGAISTMAVGAIFAIILYCLSEVSWAFAIVLISVLSVINAINTYRYGLQNAARQRYVALGLETGDRVLQQVFAILLLWLVTDDPLVALLGYLISASLFFYINDFFYKKTFDTSKARGCDKSKSSYSVSILNYAWPFFLFGVFAWVQTASDRWLLNLFQSIELVGQYALLNQIGFQSLTLMIGSISYFLTPILYNRAGGLNRAGQFDDVNRINNWYLFFNLILTLGLCLLFWLFGAEIIRFFSNEKYVEMSNLLPIMALAGGIFNFSQTYSMRFMFGMQTKHLLYPKIGGAIVGVLLNYFLLQEYGLLGLVWAAVAGQLVYLLLLVITWRITHEKMLIVK